MPIELLCTSILDLPLEIREIIYITNVVENLNSKIRKYNKNKMSIPADESVLKSVYLSKSGCLCLNKTCVFQKISLSL
jgi:transposase-like protein